MGIVERLDDVAIFVKVVDHGSFTAAAEALGMSQPVVSRAVGRLEEQLGVRLLNRTTRRISLTEAGGELYRQSAQALAAVENAALEVARFQTEPRGTLRVSAPSAFATLHLGPVIAAFLARFPGVTLDLVLDDRVVDLVEDGFDMAIRIGSLRDSNLVARRLAPCRQRICAAPAYLERHGRPETLEDLLGHNCLQYTLGRDPRAWRLADAQGNEVVLPVRGSLQANSGMMEREAALAGLGIVYLPTFYIGDELRAGRLVPLLEHLPLPELGVFAVYPQRRNLAPKVRAFVDFLAEAFGDRPYWDRGLGFGY